MGENTAAVAALQQALRGASENVRFFRSLAQWVSAYIRYSAVAVCVGHLTWQDIVAHLQIVAQLYEAERMKGSAGTPQLAFVYDEFLRREIARRAERNDMTLDMRVVFLSECKEVKDLAKARLAGVLSLARVGSISASSSGSARGPGQEETLKAQLDAAQDLRRQSEASMASLAAQNAEFNRRQDQSRYRGGWDGGKGGQPTSKAHKKQIKSDAYFEKNAREKAERLERQAGKRKWEGSKGHGGQKGGRQWY